MTHSTVLRAQADALEATAAVLRSQADELDATHDAEAGRLLTVGEVCERLQLHENTVHKMLASGELPGWKVRHQWRIPADRLGQVMGMAS